MSIKEKAKKYRQAMLDGADMTDAREVEMFSGLTMEQQFEVIDYRVAQQKK